MVVHLANERLNLRGGEFPDAVAKETLVFGQSWRPRA
jgi:hypothetical protein